MDYLVFQDLPEFVFWLTPRVLANLLWTYERTVLSDLRSWFFVSCYRQGIGRDTLSADDFLIRLSLGLAIQTRASSSFFWHCATSPKATFEPLFVGRPHVPLRSDRYSAARFMTAC